MMISVRFSLARCLHAFAFIASVGMGTAGASDRIPIDVLTAVKEHQYLCRQDGGRLWATSLCGPLMLVSPKTRVIWTDEPFEKGQSTTADTHIFVGTLPPDVPIANTATDWRGRRWTMVLLPLPAGQLQRRKLLMHESFHAIQPSRLPPPVAALPDHLDTLDGRVAIRLEWRALARALASEGEIQRSAIKDALAFRAWRRSKIGDAAKEENALEIDEGIPEYTGWRLGSTENPTPLIVKMLSDYDHRQNYIRNFPYASGPAYGFLLDRIVPDWRLKITPASDLGEMLHCGIKNGTLPNVRAAEDRYGYKTIILEEKNTEGKKKSEAERWKTAFFSAPNTQLPLSSAMTIQFNPQNLISLGTLGTVFPNAVIRDAWGTLTVTQGVLITKNHLNLWLKGSAVLRGRQYEGEGWSLSVSSGWYPHLNKDDGTTFSSR
ncbi:hypothetical protein A0J51_02546 [Gluconobacter japonicus]|nr:hypothetical protein A0J51_02546 [Gluconobacter japonicus]